MSNLSVLASLRCDERVRAGGCRRRDVSRLLCPEAQTADGRDAAVESMTAGPSACPWIAAVGQWHKTMN